MKNLNKTISLLALTLGYSLYTSAQTTVASIISSNQTWTAAGSPYILPQNILVNKGVTIDVKPGVTIQGSGLLMIINGEFTAIGTKDSVIVIDSVELQFTAESVDYDKTTGTGSQFQYCLFPDGGSGVSRTITLTQTSMFVKNCKFINRYYYIYSYNQRGGGSDLIVEKSIFTGNNRGYVTYLSSDVILEMTDCYAENIMYIYTGNNATITKCAFINLRSVKLTTRYTNVVLKCNLFKDFQFGVLDLTYPGPNANVEIVENTFDGAQYFISFSAKNLSNSKTVIKNNNFLAYTSNSIKTGRSSTPGIYDTLNFQGNYWGAGSTATIDAGIHDFNDDITLDGVIDYGNRRTTLAKTCTGGGTIGGADTSGVNVGVYELTNEQISLYPNPADLDINVSANGQMIHAIIVTDLQGKTSIELNESNLNHTLDVSTLVEGIYIIEARGDGFISRNKLVVKH
ncbi:MAG: hypothetical protein ACI9JN_001488 [Bacteroidia bacterium]|jgi:hypothetical protein